MRTGGAGSTAAGLLSPSARRPGHQRLAAQRHRAVATHSGGSRRVARRPAAATAPQSPSGCDHPMAKRVHTRTTATGVMLIEPDRALHPLLAARPVVA